MSLTQTAAVARKSIAGTFLAMALYTVGYFSAPLVKSAYLAVFPPKNKPEIIYGMLPAIQFDGLLPSPVSSPEFSLSTKDGRLPDITQELVNVYKVYKPAVSFSAGKKAQNNAEILHFGGENLVSGLTGSEYRWVDDQYSRQLDINIGYATLEYEVDMVSNQNNLKAGTGALRNDSVKTAKALLTNLGYYKDILFTHGSEKVTYGKIQSGRILETTTLSEAKLAKVDFFRTIFKAPILGPRSEDGLLQVIISDPIETVNWMDQVKITAHEWSINTDTFGKYPAISVQAAWQAITQGNGIYAKIKLKSASSFEPYETTTVSKIAIQNIQLGYYDSLEFQEYLQPIYVFDGTFSASDGNSGTITIYYPAIDPRYIATEPEKK